jgi:pimeloyl-ACP methyl ester carboxylesterase
VALAEKVKVRYDRPFTMKAKPLLRALFGGLLCAVGFWLTLAIPYQSKIFLTDNTSCRMAVEVVEPVSGEPLGSVVLLHGLSANKKIMEYMARGFSEKGLRVFVPDLPGHGRTPGPFSFSSAECCSESFLNQLIAHGAVDPARTILAGHSMGGAIALRLAAQIPVGGATVLSPAPMRTEQGVPRELLPFENPPPTPANTLIISASWEPRPVRETARDLLSRDVTTTGRYILVPRSTHVSLLFDREALQASQNWAARVLHLDSEERLPSKMPLLGFGLGFAGLILLTAPFVRELLGTTTALETYTQVRGARAFPEVGVFSLVAVLLLRAIHPYHILHVFEGDYLAGFLLLVGAALLLSHHRDVLTALRAGFTSAQLRTVLLSSFCAIVILLLYSGWFDLTFSAAWLTSARWLRFPLFFLMVLPYHFAEEIIAGPLASRSKLRRLTLVLSLRFLAWGALAAGVFFLHSGEILLILLFPYFAIFCVLQRLGMDVVRGQTGSATSAAIFGAILMSGFCLAIFPVA